MKDQKNIWQLKFGLNQSSYHSLEENTATVIDAESKGLDLKMLLTTLFNPDRDI